MKILDDLRMAADPVLFMKSLGMTPDLWQEGALRHRGTDILLCCSRQAGKSTIAAVKSLHRAIYYPKSLILLLSPSQRQSSELFRKVAEFCTVCNNLPERTEDSKQFMTLSNGSRIVSLPGKESSVRGYSAPSLIIEDESAQCEDELYFAVRPMLIVSKGDIMLMSTPRGKRGHFFREWEKGGDAFERIEIPATECPRIGKEDLERERERIGDFWFKQEYMCQFLEAEGQLFSYEDIEAMHSADVRPFFSGTSITSEIKPFKG